MLFKNREREEIVSLCKARKRDFFLEAKMKKKH